MNCPKWISLMFPHDQVVHSQLEFCMVTVSPSQGLTARDRERLLLLIGDFVLITQTSNCPVSPLCVIISDSTLFQLSKMTLEDKL